MPGCWVLELSMTIPPEAGVRCSDMIGQTGTYLGSYGSHMQTDMWYHTVGDGCIQW